MSSSFILFLNKTDVFDEKIMYTNLGDYLEEYTGPKKDAAKAKEFIANMFKKDVINRTLYSHYTCATGGFNYQTMEFYLQLNFFRHKEH